MPRKRSSMYDVPRDLAHTIRIEQNDAMRFLHVSTSPEEIRRVQRNDVRVYRKEHPEATPAEIGAAIVLPTWIVECRLAELDDLPVPYKNRTIGKMSGLGLSPNYIPKGKERPPTEEQRAAKNRVVLGPARKRMFS